MSDPCSNISLRRSSIERMFERVGAGRGASDDHGGERLGAVRDGAGATGRGPGRRRLPAVLAGTTALVGLTAPFAEAQPVRLASTVVVGTVPARTVVVGTGDTLWSIAERIAPQADPRDVVADLEQANHLSGATVQAGE